MNGGSLASNHGENYGTNGSLITNTGNVTDYNDDPTKFLRGVYGSKVGNVISLDTYEVGTAGLHNYNNSSYINITREGFHVEQHREWRTSSGSVFDQENSTITASRLTVACGIMESEFERGDVTVTLYARWVVDEPTQMPTIARPASLSSYEGSFDQYSIENGFTLMGIDGCWCQDIVYFDMSDTQNEYAVQRYCYSICTPNPQDDDAEVEEYELVFDWENNKAYYADDISNSKPLSDNCEKYFKFKVRLYDDSGLSLAQLETKYISEMGANAKSSWAIYTSAYGCSVRTIGYVEGNQEYRVYELYQNGTVVKYTYGDMYNGRYLVTKAEVTYSNGKEVMKDTYDLKDENNRHGLFGLTDTNCFLDHLRSEPTNTVTVEPVTNLWPWVE